MSVRNMLKVMMSLLLAMALAATPAHAARFDRSYASVAKEALQVKGKSETIVKSEVFPYGECAEKCDGICLCAAIWPPPATCLCTATIESTSTVGEAKELYNKLDMLAGPVQKGTSGDDKKMVVWTKGKMEAIPYKECIKTCEICACTLPWPPEASICICITPKLDVLAGPVQKGTSGDDKKMVVWTKGKMEAIPYEKCIKTCEMCACTLPWPPEASICICITPKLDVLVGPVQKGTSGDDEKMVVWTEGKMEAIPYEECIKTCEKCFCTLPWPPEASICICITPKLDVLAGPIKKGTSGDDKKMVVWTKAKMEAIPYEECIKTCEKCFCTLPWPPEAVICICITSKPQVVGVKALAM